MWLFLINVWPVYERSAIASDPSNAFYFTKIFKPFVSNRSWHGFNGMDNGQKNEPIKQNPCLPRDADYEPSKSDAGSGGRSYSS